MYVAFRPVGSHKMHPKYNAVGVVTQLRADFCCMDTLLPGTKHKTFSTTADTIL